VLINQINDSNWSTDYDRLVELMKQNSIVCTIEYKWGDRAESSIRDVGKTSYKPIGLEEEDDGTYEISVRGCAYLMTWSEAKFKGACDKYKVRFLDLASSSGGSAVNHPPHYQQVSEIGKPILVQLNIGKGLLGLECLDAIEILEKDAGWGFCLLNAVKYLWRSGLKGDAAEDLRKARWYLAHWLRSIDESETPPRRIERVKTAIELINQALKENRHE
jgi:hypothetical protein